MGLEATKLYGPDDRGKQAPTSGTRIAETGDAVLTGEQIFAVKMQQAKIAAEALSRTKKIYAVLNGYQIVLTTDNAEHAYEIYKALVQSGIKYAFMYTPPANNGQISPPAQPRFRGILTDAAAGPSSVEERRGDVLRAVQSMLEGVD